MLEGTGMVSGLVSRVSRVQCQMGADIGHRPVCKLD